MRLHLADVSLTSSASCTTVFSNRAAIGLQDQLLVHKEVHLPSPTFLQVFFNELIEGTYSRTMTGADQRRYLRPDELYFLYYALR